MRKLTFTILVVLSMLTIDVKAQSFGIGTDAPDPQSILDIVATDKGVFIPRMTTVQRDANITPSLNATDEGLFIYNNDDSAFNYWDGTQWVVIGSSTSDDWTIVGNAGTDADANFIGTTDAVDFVMRTNNTERARILSGGNFGIGTPSPNAKLHVIQNAASRAIEIYHSGASGNGIYLNTNNASNGSSGIWLIMNSLGRGINIEMNNVGSQSEAILISQDGNGVFARGVSVNMASTTTAAGTTVFQDGIGIGQYIGITNTTSTAIGSSLIHDGLGFGYYAAMTNSGETRQALLLLQNGSGAFSRGSEIGMEASTVAIGSAVFQNGTGVGHYVDLGNTANANPAVQIVHDGLGYGQYIEVSSNTNVQSGQAIFYDGDGIGQYIGMTNTAATNNSVGLFAVYEGTGTSAAGGGNVAEFQHNGTNGNAVDIFIGSPSIAPGPANTTSEHTGLVVAQYATGTSSGGNLKSAISASNYSADPTVLINNGGTEVGSGLEAYTTPGGTVDPIAILGSSYDATYDDYGVGVRGFGGWYGVQGVKLGTNYAWTFGVYASGDYGGTGAKHFVIDYPLDPANKALRHYSVESNEILNVYRGIAVLNRLGEAVVDLPEYFDAVNTNPTYQLTSIGTPNQAYIKKEVSGNQFVIAGQPNTKVSWEIHANRNDPTIQYYDRNGKKYAEEVFEKPAKMKGKYYTPEAYGKPRTAGIHYNEAQEKRHANLEMIMKGNSALNPNLEKVERQKQGDAPNTENIEKSKGLEPND